MRKILIAFISLFLFTTQALALEVVRQKNVASYVVFPIMKNDGTLISSAAGLDSEIDAYADGSAPDGFTDCTNEATEIGSTGQYYLSLTNTELNVDYAIVQIKSSSTGAITQTLLIRTQVGDPLLFATTDDGGTINVTTGKIDEVNKLTELDEDNTTIDINGATIGTATSVTNAVVLPTGTGAGQISLSSGAVILQADQAVNVTKIEGLDATDQLDSHDGNPPSAADIKIALEANGTSILDTLGDRILGTLAAGTHTAQSGDAYARLGAPAGASVSVDIAAVKADTAAILTDTAAMDTANELRTLLTGGTSALSILTATDNIGINWADIANPTTAVNLSGTNIKTDQVVASVSGAVGSVTGGVTVTTNNDKTGYALTQAFPANFANLSITATTGLVDITQTAADKVWGTATRTLTAGTNIALAKGVGITGFNDIAAADVWGVVTRTLTAGTNISLAKGTGITGFNDLDAAGVAAAVWNAATASYGTANTYGALLETNLDAAVTSRGTSTLTAQQVWEYATRTLTAGAYSGLQAADITAIWNKDISGWTIAGLAGTYLKSASAPAAAVVAAAVWDLALTGHTTTGTTGEALSNASSAGNPWDTDISTGYEGKAGEVLRQARDAAEGININ